MNRLKELRENIGLSQQSVADKLHISRQAYNFYENERRAMNPAIMIKIADFYKVTLDELFGRVILNKNKPLDFNLTTKEIDHIKKYRTLDERGKEAVDENLEREYVNSLKAGSKETYDAISAY